MPNEPRAASGDAEVRRPCRIALAGFGTVGRSVVRILCERPHPRLRLTHIVNRDVERRKVDWVPADVRWTSDIEAALRDGVDVLVELIGGLTPAEAWIRRALESGVSVVTANKQVMARRGPDLVELAMQHGCRLGFEASVAGGIPVVRAIQQGLAGDGLVRILGIVNGTCNYILTRMEAGAVPFAQALREAQQLGFAEADPTEDVEGLDAQAKLAILCAVGFQTWIPPDEIPRQTVVDIEPVDFVYARRLESAIRQVSFAEQTAGGIVAAVRPMLVPRSSLLARVEGSQNIVIVRGRYGGETALSGYGAGGDPTAVAVVSDLIAIADATQASPLGRFPDSGHTGQIERDWLSPHYLRFTIADRPGVIAELAGLLSRHQINIDAVLQEPGWPKHELPFVITLEACLSSSVERALQDIIGLDFHVRPPLWLPMLPPGERS